MTAADQNFLQVTATILIGTFIAYVVDLRREHPRTRLSGFSPGMRRFMKIAALLLGVVTPAMVTVALLLTVYCLLFDALWFPAKALIFFAVVISITVLGVQKIMGAMLARWDE